MMRVADYIMHRLTEEGVGHVFQVTGRGALFLSDGLAKHKGLVAISLHHEQACAFAAIGYAEQSGSIGACLVSTGCASTNALTGVLSAWQDGIPCIFISGQNTLKETSRHTRISVRTYGQQEADIISMVSSITKFSHMLTRPQDIVEVMNTALESAQTGRKGPVWIDIPLDLQSALINPEDIQTNPTANLTSIAEADDEDISRVLHNWSEAKRPALLIGSGVKSAGVESDLRVLVERYNIPLTFTSSAPDVMGSTHPLSIGSVGAMGCSRAGNFVVQNADFLLVLGSRLTSLNTGPDFCKFARSAYVVVVDIDPVEHSKESIDIDQFIESDVSHFIKQIGKSEQQKALLTESAWVEKCLHWKKLFSPIETQFQSEAEVDLYQLADKLSENLPTPSTLVVDSGLNDVILPTNVRFSDGIRCIHPVSQGAMGFALPAAIGVHYATSHPVVAVIGDGSIMMNLQELQSVRYHNMPVKIIVINNNVYSIIRRRQRDLFRKRTIGTDPNNGVSCPEFANVADCFGLKYVRVNHVGELDSGLATVFEEEGPVLCEIMGREDQSYIEVGQTRSVVDRRFVRRPLEDQEPFLARDLFTREMIVEVIDQ